MASEMVEPDDARDVVRMMQHAGLLDVRAAAYLRYLLIRGVAMAQFDPVSRTGGVYHRRVWYDCATFCAMAGEERGHDSAPPPPWRRLDK